MHTSTRLITVSSLVWLAACTDADPDIVFESQELAIPTANPATGPRITGGNEGGLILSWMEPSDDTTALKYSRFQDGGWSAAASVVSIDGMFINWADLPSVIALGDGQLAAHWLQLSGGSPYAYDVAARLSTDNGDSWSNIVTPHTDGTDTEHGFVSMFAYESQLGMLWLDGRKFVNEVSDDPVASGMTLRAAFVNEDLQLQREQLVDDLICDCCQTDIAVTAEGPVAVYRDRSVDEIRDILVTRFVEGQWQPGKAISDDRWRIDGCPVNGPAIAATGDTVAVAWFTVANKTPIIKLAVSANSGESFAQPITVREGNVLGHVDIALLDDQQFAVSWLQVSDAGIGEVMVRKVAADGKLGPIHTVSYGASSFSVPQMAKFDAELVFVWTESTEFIDHIKSAKVPVAALSSQAN